MLCAAHGQSLELSLPRERAEAEPGAVIVLIAVLDNTSEEEIAAEIEVDVPTGWQLVLPPGMERLAAGESVTIALPVVVPEHPLAGEHEVRVQVSSGVVVSTSASFIITIPAVRELRATVESAPNSILAEAYEVVFRVTNRGNQRERLQLSASSGRQVSLRPDPVSLDLAPGESAPVRVPVPALQGLERPVQHAVTLTVMPTREGESVTAVARTDVIALAQPERLAYHTYPVEFRLDLSAQTGLGDGESRFSVDRLELSGRGQLRENSGVEVSFRARYGPSEAGRHFELVLAGSDYRIVIGEQRQGLGPLLPSATGTGLSIRALGPGVPVNMYGLAASGVPRGGFTVGPYRAGEAVLTGRGAFGPGLVALSVRSAFAGQPAAGVRYTLEVEPAVDAMEGAPAIYSTFRVRAEGFSLESTVEHRESGFLGRRDDRSQFRVDGRVELPAQLELVGRYNATVTPGFVTTRARAGIEGITGDVDWSVRYSVDSYSFESSSTGVRSLSATATYLPPEGWAVGSSVSWSSLRSSITGSVQDQLAVQLVGVQPVDGGNVSFGVRAGYSLTNRDLTGASLTAVWQGELTQSTAGRLRLNHAVAGNLGSRVEAGVTHELPDGTELGAEVDLRVATPGPGSLAANLEMLVPIELRLGLRAGVTAVSGRIVDEQGEGIAGLVVTLAGFSTLTVPDGTFTFPAIPAGDQLLFVQGLDPSQITIPPVPLSVTVPSVVVPYISVLDEATVAGVVELQELEEGETARGVAADPAAAASPPLGGLRLILEGEGRRRTALTNPGGRFEFSRLPPETWTLSLDPETIPPGYEIAAGPYEVQTSPGRRVEFEFLLQPARRNIRFSGGGSLSCTGVLPLPPECGADYSAVPAEFE